MVHGEESVEANPSSTLNRALAVAELGAVSNVYCPISVPRAGGPAAVASKWLVWRGRFPPAASDERDRLAARHAWLEEAAFGAENVAQALTCVCEPRLGDLGPGQRLATRLWTGPELRGEVRGAQRLVSGALRTPLGTEAVRNAAPDVLSKLEEMELAYAQLDDRGWPCQQRRGR
ncbi:hypothetical protein QBZ16_002215 [Prototheca wickerhamii]|uniref:Uncharacterized protein n=1 Tax=Prototheca wickerhamii TaxID=3111 RepID=A0AAD9IN35_PROWI|nr:hypothetical protein QBZ16_002215 [Prototheca wickerhamii]